MQAEHHMEQIIEAVKEWKSKDFAMGNRDSLPQLGFLSEGAEHYERVPDFVVEQALQRCGGEVPMALGAILLNIPINFPDITKFRSLTFVADGYTTVVPRDEFETVNRGDLGEEFRNNPATDIIECLTVLLADDDLVGGVELSLAQLPYVVTDGGVLQFKEPIIHADGDNDGARIEGAIPDIVRKAWFDAFE